MFTDDLLNVEVTDATQVNMWSLRVFEFYVDRLKTMKHNPLLADYEFNQKSFKICNIP